MDLKKLGNGIKRAYRTMNNRTSRRDMHINSYDCEITVVIPVFKNAEMLQNLVGRIHIALDNSSVTHRILAIDDASPDESWKVLSQIEENDDRLGAIQLESNVGQHKALYIGLLLSNSPWVAVMDADLQDSPEVLPELLSKAKSAGATVFAERYGEHENRYRLLASKVYKTLLSWLIGVPRSVGTFFVISDEVVKVMLEYKNKTPQVVVMAVCASDKLETVAFRRLSRPSGKSSYSTSLLFRAAWNGYRNVFYCLISKIGWGINQNISISTIRRYLGWAKKINKNLEIKGRN